LVNNFGGSLNVKIKELCRNTEEDSRGLDLGGRRPVMAGVQGSVASQRTDWQDGRHVSCVLLELGFVGCSKEDKMDKRSNVSDKRNVKLEEIMKSGYIPFMEGRPERDNTICDDDIANLKIALHTASDLVDFMRQV
jgi:hypothetical protein